MNFQLQQQGSQSQPLKEKKNEYISFTHLYQPLITCSPLTMILFPLLQSSSAYPMMTLPFRT